MNNGTYIHEVSLKGIDENNPMVQYTDGDIAILESVRQLHEVNPMRAKMNFIILCSAGRVELDVNGQRRQMEQGDVLFSCPGVVLSGFMISPDFECKILCLSERIVQGLLHEHVEVWNRAVYVRRVNVVSLDAERVRITALYHELVRQTMRLTEREFFREAVQSLVRALLFELCSILAEGDRDAEDEAQGRRLSQSRQYFDRFLSMLSRETVKRRPVNFYASRLAVTPKYLTMVCETYSDKPAKDWINQYVVEDVRYCLKSTSMPIKEIADRLGFSNISHFGTYVRRHFGMSPTALRTAD